MGPHPTGHIDATALLAVVDRVVEQFAGEDAGLHRSLVVVEIVDEQVERLQPLDETGRYPGPLAGGDDPGYDVHRPGPVDRGVVGVEGEGDTHRPDRGLAGLLALQQLGPELVDPTPHLVAAGTSLAVRCQELVEVRAGVIAVPVTGGKNTFGHDSVFYSAR